MVKMSGILGFGIDTTGLEPRRTRCALCVVWVDYTRVQYSKRDISLKLSFSQVGLLVINVTLEEFNGDM